MSRVIVVQVKVDMLTVSTLVFVVGTVATGAMQMLMS
jgi:hypothetical protein